MATKRLVTLLGSVLVVSAPGVALADNDTKLVDCTKGHSIQKAIDKRNPDRSLTLMIRGTCNENVTVDRDDLALVGEAGATVNGTISIPGSRRVLIRALKVSSPTGAGVEGTDNAAFTVEDSFLERNATEGLAVRNGAFATVRRTRLAENGQNAPADSGRGIDARHGASVAASNNTIVNNRSDGVGVYNGAYALLVENTVEGNGRIAASEAGVQVNRARARGNGNIIRNNTGLGGVIVTNHGDYRTGSGINTADIPDNEFAFEQIQHPLGPTLMAVEVSNGGYGDFRQVNITGSVFVGDHAFMLVRGDQVTPNLTCSSIDTTGGFLQVSGRHGLLRLRGVKTTPAVPPGQAISGPFGLRDIDPAVCP